MISYVFYFRVPKLALPEFFLQGFKIFLLVSEHFFLFYINLFPYGFYMFLEFFIFIKLLVVNIL